MIIPRTSEFFALSREIAEGFLQTAVVVDDYAGLGPYSEGVARDKIAAPPRGRRQSTAQEERPERSELPAEPAGPPDGETPAHYLNAKKVTDGFARKGIVCSVIRPNKGEMDGLADLLSTLADRADILVLDWQLDKDNGQHALALLCSILRPDTGHLRLLAIYTGEPKIQKIAPTIKDRLERESRIRFEEDGDLALKWRGGRIVVLAKQRIGVDKRYWGSVVEFENLVDRLTEEFATLTEGLVSNVVVEGLAKVRNNASRILRRFSDGLDAPYLAHRFMLPEPVDAEAFLTALVGEELLGILEEADVGSKAGIGAIQAWFTASGFAGLNVALQKVSVSLALSVLRDGLKSQSEISPSKQAELHRDNLTGYFKGSDSGAALDERFSCITTMRARYANTRPPMLTLGTVVKDADDGSRFYVCVQPRCDSVRLVGPRNFPFLPLWLVQEGSNGPFDTIVLEKVHYRRLRGSRKACDLVLISFQPGENSHGVIQALPDGEDYYFMDTSELQRKYTWMGELRSEQALRLSNDFAAVLGRVGLHEYEWLRRWAGKHG